MLPPVTGRRVIAKRESKLPEGYGREKEVDGVDGARPHPEHPEGRDAEDRRDDGA